MKWFGPGRSRLRGFENSDSLPTHNHVTKGKYNPYEPGEGYVFHVKTPKKKNLDVLKKPLNLLVDPSDVCWNKPLRSLAF